MFEFTGLPILNILFKLIFIMVAGIAIAKLIDYWIQWNHNQQSPHFTLFAKVVSKRTSIIYLSETDDHYASRRYFVTFEVASGERMEFCVSGPEYRMLLEDDEGLLSFQGSDYLEFEKEC